ncbi:winged helix-turn-helix domain-containing protein [Photobacterium sp. DNB23_23_1]
MPKKVKASAHIAQISDNFFFDSQKKTLFTILGNVSLNRAEKEVLSQLIDQSPNMVSKEELLSVGWARKEVAETSLFQTIRTLRIKLKEEEVGQFIKLVPRLGYQINIQRRLTSDEYHALTNTPKHKKPHSKVKIGLVLSLILAAIAVLIGFLTSEDPVEYKYKLVNDEKNNTLVFLSMHQDDFDYLLQASDIFITPGNLSNKLMFIHKLDDNFSIAICDKTPTGCDIDTAHAISFKHSQLSTVWELLGNYLPKVPALAAMNVLKDNTSVQSGVKSYNIFLEDGDFTISLSHHFANLVDEGMWLFTTINYQPNADQSEFIAASLRGVRSIMADSSPMPFLITMKNYPEYFSSVLSPDDKQQLGIKPLGDHGSQTNDFNVDVDEYTSYLLYRQDQLQLWLSEGYEFHWFIKSKSISKSDDNVFNRLIKGKCSMLPIKFENETNCL